MNKPIENLSEQSKVKAFKDFIDFAECMGHDATHTISEFIETSNINEWLYDEEGNFIK